MNNAQIDSAGGTDQPAATGPVALRPDGSPRSEFLWAAVGALLWWGFIAFAGWDVISSFLYGQPNWKGGLAILPFAIIGLMIIGQAGKAFLGMYGPRPSITINTPTVSLGDTMELEWRFIGNTGSLRSLEIYLVGEQRIRVRSRGRCQTESEAFVELPIIELERGSPTGRARVSIPESSMHSFKADHSEIVWSVDVFADVEFWPDVAVGFPIVVLPKPIKAEVLSGERAED
jgi:hypothetical protein